MVTRIKDAKHKIEKWSVGSYDEASNMKVLKEMFYFVSEHEEALRAENKDFFEAIQNIEKYLSLLKEFNHLMLNLNNKSMNVDSNNARRAAIKLLDEMQSLSNHVEKELKHANKIVKHIE